MIDLSVLFGKTKKRLDPEIAVLLSMEITSAVNQIPSAELSFTLPANVQHSKVVADLNTVTAACDVGAEVEIRHQKTLMFAGLVTKQSIKYKDGRPTLTLRLRDKLFLLQTQARSQVFIKKTDKAIFTQLLQGDKVPAGAESGLAVEHEQMVQLNCTDWQFLRTRLQANDVWLLPHPDGVVISPPKLSSAKAHHTMTPQRDDHQLLGVQWQKNYLAMGKGVTVHSWDIDKQALNSTPSKATTLGSGVFDPTKLNSALHKAWDLSYSMPLNSKEQTTLANAMATTELARGIQVTVSLLGSAEFKLGDTLAMDKFGSHLDGKGIITEIVQNAEHGKWVTTLRTGLETLAMGEESYDLLPKADGLYVGVVAAMKEDKQFRIQVQIPALGKSSPPLWARFSQPYASKESGICFYPEKDDEVVIAFFEGDPRYPVIMGSMHNAKNKPPFPHSKDNEQRGFVFVHQKEKQTLLFNRKTSQVSLENFAEDKDKHQSLLLDAQKMTIDLQNNSSTAKQKQLVKLDADSMQIKVQNNAEEAKQNQSLLFDAKEMKIQLDNTLNATDKKQMLLLNAKEMMVKVDNVTEILELNKGVALTATKESITLNSKEKDIKLTAKVGVELDSDNHTIKAKKALKLDSPETAITGSKTLKLESEDTSINGKSKLTQSGAEINVKATASMKLEGGNNFNAVATTVKIEGTGTAAIKSPHVDLG